MGLALNPPVDVSKDDLYGRYQKGEDARSKLAMKAAHKALDIPEDDVNINATTTNTSTSTGIGTKGLVGAVLAGSGVAAAAALGAVTLLGGFGKTPTPTAPPPTTPIVAPTANEYEAVYKKRKPGSTAWVEFKREPLTGAK